MSKKWMFLWSAIAVILLWKWSDIAPARTALNWSDGTMFSRKGLASLLQRRAVNASDRVDSSVSDRVSDRVNSSASDRVNSSAGVSASGGISDDRANDRVDVGVDVGVDVSTRDSLSHPPVTQSFVTGGYRFVVAATDEWQTPAAIGQLYRGDRLLWESSLPQQYGPRFVVVGRQGHVLLVDEFINVASPYALMLLDPAGEPVATHAFEDIQQVLSVSTADLTQQAISGWWVAAAPQVEPAEAAQFDGRLPAETVLISAGGRRLSVDLLTGDLTSAED